MVKRDGRGPVSVGSAINLLQADGLFSGHSAEVAVLASRKSQAPRTPAASRREGLDVVNRTRAVAKALAA
jgi:hypothetical protein